MFSFIVSHPENDKTAMGIWRTNNFCLGRSGPRADNGIFLELSRFNHSCMPNAEFHWNSVLKKQEVRAIKDIRQDEEVTLCYMTGNAMAKVRLNASPSAKILSVDNEIADTVRKSLPFLFIQICLPKTADASYSELCKSAYVHESHAHECVCVVCVCVCVWVCGWVRLRQRI